MLTRCGRSQHKSEAGETDSLLLQLRRPLFPFTHIHLEQQPGAAREEDQQGKQGQARLARHPADRTDQHRADDGVGRPLRYLSVYGGMVTKML